MVAGAWGCTLDRSGLDELPIHLGDADGDLGPDAGADDASDAADDGVTDDTGAGGQGGSGQDARPDLIADVPLDHGIDQGVDVRPDVVTPDSGPDLAPDAPVDLPADRTTTDVPVDIAMRLDTGIDLPGDRPTDTAPTCNPASQHVCSNACVENTSTATCGSTSCVACAVPANGTATCNGASCGINCNTNFVPSGSGATCVRSCTPACDAGAGMVTGPGGRFTGVTAGVSNSVGSCGGADAPEAVFHVVLATPSDVFVTTHGTRFDTVVYLRNGCCGTEIACNDNSDGRRTSTLSATNLAAGSYDVFVDGLGAADAGAFTVDIFVSPTSPTAGDSCGRPAHIAGTALAGTTCGMRDDAHPQPGCQATNNPGGDVVYYFVLDEPAVVSFNTCTGTCLDSVLYVRDVCSDDMTELMCNDDACPGCSTSGLAQQSRVTRLLAAGAHYLVVDTLGGTACGAYTVTPVNVPP